MRAMTPANGRNARTCGLAQPTWDSLTGLLALKIAHDTAIGRAIVERDANICAGRMRGSWAQYPDHSKRFAPKRKGCNIRRG